MVIFHWRYSWDVDIDKYTGFFEDGRLGVDVFFVLSGFVLAHVYFAKVRKGQFDYWRFLVARLARIYPLHIIVFAFVGFMLFGSKLLGVPAQTEAFPPGHILPNILLIQAWGLTPGATWNVPAWSISAEWFAYLLFPLFALIGLKFINRPVAGLLIGLLIFFVFDLIYQAYVGSYLPSATDNFGILRIVPEFLMGFFLYLIGQRYSLKSKSVRILALSITVIVMVLSTHWHLDERFIALLSLPLVFFLAEISKVNDPVVAKKVNGFDPVEYMGRVSYSIYLLHVPFFMTAYNLMDDVFGWVDGQLSTGLMVVLLIIFMPICMLSYHFIEEPARHFVRHHGDRMVFAIRRAFSGQTSPTIQPSSSRINQKDLRI